MRPYARLILHRNHPDADLVKALQRDLRALGYLRPGIDGRFGPQTEFGVKALQHDLLHYDGRPRGAPVSVCVYNRGRVTAVTGRSDSGLAACIEDLLNDPAFPKLPSSPDPKAENQRALAAFAATTLARVPKPFLHAILRQESNLRHFQIPTPKNEDNFVTVGLDQRDPAVPHITSRGYGLGQYTFFHHPPMHDEVRDVILDPVRNLERAVRELREKFDRFVVSNDPRVRADDRHAEHPGVPLRECQFADPADPRRLTDCRNCLRAASAHDIVMGQTPWYPGAPEVHRATRLYKPHQGRYETVPNRAEIPCDWPYATRRYNGSGQNAYHYQVLALLRVAGRR